MCSASVASSDGASWLYRRDTAGRVVTATDTVDASHPLVIDRAYNGSGLVASLTVGARAPRSSFYDADGRLTRIEQPDGTIKGIDLVYDRSGLPTRIGALTPESFAYDAAGRVTSLSAGPLARTYSRDAAGRVISESGERFGYDAAGRLTSWYDRATDTTTAYEYDAASNLTRQSTGATPTLDLTFDASNRITSGGYAYDANGNLTRRPGQRLVYDALNRLTAVVNDSTEATIAAYTYDPSNRRTSSTTTSGTVYFHYDGSSGDVIAETNGTGRVTCQYVRDGGGRLVAVERFDDTSESCFTNQRGDVVGHWTNSGTPSETVRFDPWGNMVSGGVSTSVPYGFAGCRYDKETGLYYMWNRYYDPVTHRFVTKDLYPGETTNPATMNPYLYCLGDPVNAVDPSGLMTIDEFVTGAAFVLGAAGAIAVAASATIPALATAGVLMVATGAVLGVVGLAATVQAMTTVSGPNVHKNFEDVSLWESAAARVDAENRCDDAEKIRREMRNTRRDVFMIVLMPEILTLGAQGAGIASGAIRADSR
jgi:RHS repeat-associated protein